MQNAAPRRILVADDEPQVLGFLTDLFTSRGWEVKTASSGTAAIETLERERFDVVLTDLKMPGQDGIAVLRAARTIQSEAEVIVMTAYSSVETAIEAMRGGAFHYLLKPFHADEVIHLAERAFAQRRLRQENQFLKAVARGAHQLHAVAAASRPMQEAVAAVMRLADTDAPVLLSGERGVGRGFLARIIHFHSARAQALFVPVYCAGSSEEVLADDLLGHEAGAYQSAALPRPGAVEMADGGTLFLADVEEAGLRIQARIAHFAASGTAARIGTDQERVFDVRLIASCGPDPEALAEKGAIAPELFETLRPGIIRVPPLRERAEDIPLLLHHFLFEANRHRKKPLRGFSGAALAALCAYSWPGNGRELARLIQTISARKKQGSIVDAIDLPSAIVYKKRGGWQVQEELGAAERADIHGAIRRIEKPMVVQALALCDDDRRRAAELLGIDVPSLEELMRRHGIEGTEKGGKVG